MVLAAEAAPTGPTWLVLALAVISALSAVLVAFLPKWIEHRRKTQTESPAAPPAPDPPARADSALSIVSDVVNDLQERLDKREDELAAAHRRIDELLEQLRGRDA